MADFWKALTKPVPFYTKENVQDTITYIKEHEAPAHNEYMLASLQWVKSILKGGKKSISYADENMIAEAAKTAEKEHDKNVIAGDFVAAVRWRYVMTACHDYRNFLLDLKARLSK